MKTAFDGHGIEMPSQVVALQATTSLAAALRGGEVTSGGSVANGQGFEKQHRDRPTPS